MPEQLDTAIRDRLARQRTELANEHTLLSYIRTAMGFFYCWCSGCVVAGVAWRSSTGCGVVGGGCRVPGGWGLEILHHQSVDRPTTGLDVRTLASSVRGGHELHREKKEKSKSRVGSERRKKGVGSLCCVTFLTHGSSSCLDSFRNPSNHGRHDIC